MTTDSRLSPAMESRLRYETIMRQARAERAAALRAIFMSVGASFMSVGQVFGHLSAAVASARQQSRGLAGARF